MPQALPSSYADQQTYGSSAFRCVATPSNARQRFEVACSSCNLCALCIPLGLSKGEIDGINSMVTRRYKVMKGNRLFRNGDQFTSLFIIRTGFLKTCIPAGDGGEQVTGFQMAGEVLGFDGIASGHHTCDAIALEDTQVCQMSFDGIVELARNLPALQFRLHQIMSRAIVRESGTRLLAIMGAEKRLAAFLLNLVDRLHALGYSPTELVLRMTREEIGSYLGLKHETVSRAFAKLSEQGLVAVDNRDIRFLRSDLLRKLVG